MYTWNQYGILCQLYFSLKRKKDWQNPRKPMKQSNTWDIVGDFHTRLANIQWAKMQNRWRWKWKWSLLLPSLPRRTGNASSLEKGLLLLVDSGCIFPLLLKNLLWFASFRISYGWIIQRKGCIFIFVCLFPSEFPSNKGNVFCSFISLFHSWSYVWKVRNASANFKTHIDNHADM